jgi:STE24 endopeptidase
VLSHRIAFTTAEQARARRYNGPRHAALLLDLGLTVLALAALAALTPLALPGPWWAAAVAAPLLVAVATGAAGLPVAWWRYRHDVEWGFATQAPPAWARDVVKETAIGAGLLVAAFVSLDALARWYPDGWAWPAATAAALLVFALGFLAPVVLEPVFNSFEPLADDDLARRLQAVADRAGVPVRQILVADASRRTTKSNAYVSGVGRTRRVVLWDTLLHTPAEEIAVVLAHELGHRARRHVAIFTGLGMVGAAAFVACLRLVRPHPTPRGTALIVLGAFLCELLAAPGLSALSRAFERTADRFSLEVTGDRPAYRALHHHLAVANLSDLDPPKWLYYWFGSHPTAPERLNDI